MSGENEESDGFVSAGEGEGDEGYISVDEDEVVNFAAEHADEANTSQHPDTGQWILHR